MGLFNKRVYPQKRDATFQWKFKSTGIVAIVLSQNLAWDLCNAGKPFGSRTPFAAGFVVFLIDCFPGAVSFATLPRRVFCATSIRDAGFVVRTGLLDEVWYKVSSWRFWALLTWPLKPSSTQLSDNSLEKNRMFEAESEPKRTFHEKQKVAQPNSLCFETMLLTFNSRCFTKALRLRRPGLVAETMDPTSNHVPGWMKGLWAVTNDWKFIICYMSAKAFWYSISGPLDLIAQQTCPTTVPREHRACGEINSMRFSAASRVACSIHIPRSSSQTNCQSRPIKPMRNLKRGTWPVMTRLYPASKSALSTAKSGAWTTGNVPDNLVESNMLASQLLLSQEPEVQLKARYAQASKDLRLQGIA